MQIKLSLTEKQVCRVPLACVFTLFWYPHLLFLTILMSPAPSVILFLSSFIQSFPSLVPLATISIHSLHAMHSNRQHRESVATKKTKAGPTYKILFSLWVSSTSEHKFNLSFRFISYFDFPYIAYNTVINKWDKWGKFVYQY